MPLDDPYSIQEVSVIGLIHTGVGEFEGLEKLDNGRFLLQYNIDGVSWVYEAKYIPVSQEMCAVATLVGIGVLSEGCLLYTSRCV